jgi:hypothetical protein
MLVCDARMLLGRPGGLPDDELGFPHPAWDAILEAWLVHLRVLDGFFRQTRPQKGDAYGRQWLKRWSGGGFLDPGDRRAIDRQLVHLNASRRAPMTWNVHQLTESACRKLLEFCEAVRAKHPERHATVRDARCFAEKFLENTLCADDCAREPVCFER